MAEAFIVRRGGGGGSGGTLVVTSSGAGTVTVSNSVLGKSYSKSVTAGGSVTFKGLKTGEWAVTLSNGAQTATRSVTINADYSVSVAYFSATISVTYPANSNCVVTNSSGTTIASDTNTGSSTKTWTATVGATGTYTVTATATDGSGKTKSTTVSITADGQSSSVTLSYGLVLFNVGDQCIDITGGWNLSGALSDSGIGSTLKIGTEGVGTNVAYCCPNNKVDVTKYSKMKINVLGALSGKTSKYVFFGVSNQKNATEGTYIVYSTVGEGVTGTLSADISSVQGDVYIVLTARYGCGAEIDRIWLE